MPLRRQLWRSPGPGRRLSCSRTPNGPIAPTLELMRHLAGAVADVPVLLIVTSRPDGEPYSARRPTSVGSRLPRLDGQAAGALVATIAGRHQLGRPISQRNPRAERWHSALHRGNDQGVIETAPAGDGVSVPATLRDSLIARLDASSVDESRGTDRILYRTRFR